MHDHIRLLYCKACRYRFSERKGTPLFHTHLPEEKARSVLQHLSEGCGVRQTGHLVTSTATPSPAWRRGPAPTGSRSRATPTRITRFIGWSPSVPLDAMQAVLTAPAGASPVPRLTLTPTPC